MQRDFIERLSITKLMEEKKEKKRKGDPRNRCLIVICQSLNIKPL